MNEQLYFPCGAAAQRRPWPPHSRGFQIFISFHLFAFVDPYWCMITHNNASQSVGLWMSAQLVAETSINSSIIKPNERSQSSVAHPSVTAIKLLVTEMLQHIFIEKINDRYIP